MTLQDSTQQNRVIIGIDPGTRITGYGILKITSSGIRPIDFGCIRPPAQAMLSDRYHIIFKAILHLVDTHKPHEMAIESQFFSLKIGNSQSVLKLGIAQGVAIIAAKENQMKIFRYTPKEVKCSIVGTGKASKEQLQGAVARKLGLQTLPTPYDAADALAIALCHVDTCNAAVQRKNREV